MAAEKIDALELDITSKLDTQNLDKVISKLGQLQTALGKLRSKSVTVKIREEFTQATASITETGEASEKAATSADKLTSSFLNQTIRIAAVIAAFKKLSGVISDSVSESLTYGKTLNMFNVSMGEYADNATKYGEAVSNALGIDISGWQKAQGIFQTLITGFGVTGDQAAYMSQNLTQLSYDIASFYNITNEEAQNKLKSAIAGRLEPIRKLGWDLSQSKLVDIAKNPKYYGQQTFAINEQTGAIEANTVAVDDNTQHKIVNFNQLTQQEKVQLRYIALMTQVTQVQGAYAKALNDPANQMKVFKEQLSMTSRELGNVFIPALNQVLPYLSAMAQLAAEAFRNIAALFGYEIPDMSDRIGIENDVEPYNDVVQATGKAANNAKKLKDYMLGIDELNVFNPNTGAGGGGGSAGGQNSNLNNLLTPGYDFLTSAIKTRLQEAREDLEKLRDDFKANPLQVAIEIIGGGMGELGSKFWEVFLGISPERLGVEAEKLGVDVKDAFIYAFLRKSISVSFALMGVDEEEAKEKAAEFGRTLWDQLWLEAANKYATQPLIETIIDLKKAEKAGEYMGDYLVKGFANAVLKLFDNPVMKFFYEAASGRNFDKDLKSVRNTINGTTNRVSAGEYAKKGSYATGTGSTTVSNANLSIVAPALANTAANEARKQGEALNKAYADGLNSGASAVNSAGVNLYTNAKNGVNGNGQGGQQFYNASANEAYKYAMGLTAPKPKSEASLGGKALAASSVNSAKSLAGDKNVGFPYVGSMAGQGYVGSINKYQSSASTAGRIVAEATLKTLKRVLGIASPSKEFGEAGYFSVLGYANYMEKYSYLAENAARDMARSSLAAVETANAYTTSNAGYGIAASNQGAMADFMSNIYNAMTSAMAGINDKGDTVIMIDGKEIFKVVKKQERESGIAIGNGAFV